jgi:zinc protease
MTDMPTEEQTLPSSQNITRTVLDNGLTVLVYEKPNVQSVVISGSMPAGTVQNTPEQAGLADMTAEAVQRGTESRDFTTLHTELERLGADLFVDAGRFKTGFGGKALAEDLPTLINLLNDVMRNPSFPSEQVERLRGETLTALNYYQQDTRYRARRAFYETLYPADHPYHYSSTGTPQTVQNLSVDDLRSFHNRYYGPQGTVMVIVGNVSANAVIDAVQAAMGDWSNANQPGMAEIPGRPTVAEVRRVFTPVPGKTQSDINMGFAGPSRYAADYQAAVLANSVLGQFGMMGRIGSVVREEKGYAYYSRSSLEGGHGPGAWNAIAGVNPTNVDETIADITDEFKRIATEPVSDEDIDNVQSYYTGSLPLQLESNEGVASIILRIETYGLGLDYLLSYRDRILALTKDDLLAAAANYINVDDLTISVAGPGDGA